MKKRVLALSLAIIFCFSAFAQEQYSRSSCQDRLSEAQNRIEQLTNENESLRRQMHNDHRDERRETTTVQTGIITNGHYLANSNCKYSFIESGSTVMILDKNPRQVNHYSKAIFVKVISNTDGTILAAPGGCTGWAIERDVSPVEGYQY